MFYKLVSFKIRKSSDNGVFISLNYEPRGLFKLFLGKYTKTYMGDGGTMWRDTSTMKRAGSTTEFKLRRINQAEQYQEFMKQGN